MKSPEVKSGLRKGPRSQRLGEGSKEHSASIHEALEGLLLSRTGDRMDPCLCPAAAPRLGKAGELSAPRSS